MLKRLRKIEGQVRGLMQMLEQDRYCLEEVQQANAISAGVREVARMIMAQHLAAGSSSPSNRRMRRQLWTICLRFCEEQCAFDGFRVRIECS